MMSGNGRLPHEHLYTRLQVSPGKGVGVFALRDIPQGVNPFLGDDTGVIRVPASVVDALADVELRRMYLDFCPLVDGSYLAPSDFNRMPISWYMNHADQPNVVCDAQVNFVAARLIVAGEELTVDYRTFSEHAERFISLWTTDAD